MSYDIIAKNLLLGNGCDNCYWCIMAVDSLRCIKANKGDTVLKPSAPLAKERTCEDWEYAPFEHAGVNPCAEIKLSGWNTCDLT